MIPLIDASALDSTVQLALRLVSWGNVGIALAALAGVLLWEVLNSRESGNHG